MKVNLFETITVSLPRARIYTRLGYAKGKTKLTPEQEDLVEKYIDQALGLIELKGSAVQIPINKISSAGLELKDGIVFESKDLAEFLKDCQEVVLMAATCGSKITEAIQKDSSGKDVTSAVVFDAVASEIVDEALTWIKTYYNSQLRRENKQLTDRRFSAGYGDFALSNQEIIFEVLNLAKLEISLSESYILVPEKTVTAVAGVL